MHLAQLSQDKQLSQEKQLSQDKKLSDVLRMQPKQVIYTRVEYSVGNHLSFCHPNMMHNICETKVQEQKSTLAHYTCVSDVHFGFVANRLSP
jgi:hypothetical protein